MRLCSSTTTCSFFNESSGYSPELVRTMRAQFCLEDNPACARKRAAELVGLANVPDDLLPTDHDRLPGLAFG